MYGFRCVHLSFLTCFVLSAVELHEAHPRDSMDMAAANRRRTGKEVRPAKLPPDI